MAHREPIIDPMFEKLLDKKTPAELKRLQTKLERDGQTQDLIGWDETGKLVGGFNRYRILRKLGKTPTIDWWSFGPDTPENHKIVADWIVEDQLAGRNLDPKRYNWYVAGKYEDELKKTKKKRGQDAARRVAAEVGKSEATVRRALRAARRIAEIAKTDPAKAERIRAGKEKLPKAPKKAKSGKVRFDHKKFRDAFGIVKRGPDDLLDAYPAAPDAAKTSARMLNQKLNDVFNAWEQLVKVVVGS